MSFRQILSSSLVVVLLIGIGCNPGSDRPETVKIGGIVTLDNAPLDGVSIRLLPNDPAGFTAVGDADQDGKFNLTTFSPNDGIIPGEYKAVLATAPSPTDDPQSRGAAPKFPAIYADPKTTTLEVVVEQKATAPIKLELSSK